MVHFGWVNHLAAVIAPNLVTAFGVFLMRQYISGAVPDELIDAAHVDGCYTLGVFWHVILPAVRPVAAVLGLLTFMTIWNAAVAAPHTNSVGKLIPSPLLS